jgi:tripartite-type tricarboxylate transporter receptor subunit TctC
MTPLGFWTGSLMMLMACAPLQCAQAQTIGTQQMRVVYPYAPGNTGDAMARVVAESLQQGLGRSVIVENRVGAGGRTASIAVKSSPPDGTTLLISTNGPMVLFPAMYPQLEYDPVKDFLPITMIATVDLGFAVGPQVPVKSLAELVTWTKANPDKGSYGSPGPGTMPHFFAIKFAQEAGLDLRHVAYRGSALALTDLTAGQLPMLSTTTADLIEQHKAGKLRVLATAGLKRTPDLPDVPTFKQSGYDVEGVSWFALFAPAGTPPAVVQRIEKVITEALASQPVRDRLGAMGFAASGISGAEMAKIQKQDIAYWAPIVHASGFKPAD